MKNGHPKTDKQQRINAPLLLRASPHLLPQSLQQASFIRGTFVHSCPSPINKRHAGQD
jgi:hypothetical protein